jgi:hypothetical protein
VNVFLLYGKVPVISTGWPRNERPIHQFYLGRLVCDLRQYGGQNR